LPLRAVIGLGNPGVRYQATRHNVGFVVVDLVAAAQGRAIGARRHGALCAEMAAGDDVVLLVKPQRFMNRCGDSVAAFVDELGIAPAALLVVHDELDLPLGRIKLKQGGGTAGHRGLESIVERLGSRDFARLRIGIGRPPSGLDVADFVLAPFAGAERPLLERTLHEAVAGVDAWRTHDLATAMSLVNAPPKPDPGAPDGTPA
jgi:PTH1 family peptidyl-tRNA hydrolase